MLKLSDKDYKTSFYNFSHWDEGTHSHKGKIEELKKRDLESVEKYLNGNFKTEKWNSLNLKQSWWSLRA